MGVDYLEIIKKVAKKIEEEYSLSPSEKKILTDKGASLLRKVQKNIKKGENLLTGLSLDDKIVLLSYIVFLRQNLYSSQGDKLNEEDAALIFHRKIYKDEEDEDRINKNLRKQLGKIGIKEKD